ncbi:MAG: YtoQ family protein [Planctomycetaceae bacterium]
MNHSSSQSITVYLSGEIHSDWRDQIRDQTAATALAVRFSGPVTDHDASDLCGVNILGPEQSAFWQDRKGSGINSVRTGMLLSRSDIVVVRFGPKYRQWNAAFDAGMAAALGKPLITLHDEELDHALKEVDAAARATARTPQQVVEILSYVLQD